MLEHVRMGDGRRNTSFEAGIAKNSPGVLSSDGEEERVWL